MDLLAPYKFKKREKEPWPRRLTRKRCRIETVIGQLVKRYQAKKVRARNCWHLSSRWLHKILSHTMSFVSAKLRPGAAPRRCASQISSPNQYLHLRLASLE